MQETIQTIKITSLYALPAIVTIPTKKIVDQYVEIATNRPKELPIIDVGSVKGKHYVINNDAVYQACIQTRLGDIQVNVTEYTTISDAIVAHVRKKLKIQVHLILC